MVFRLGGGICDAPAVVTLNRFRIHILTIDLGDEGSGHDQPRPTHVSVEDLVDIAKLALPPAEEEEDG